MSTINTNRDYKNIYTTILNWFSRFNDLDAFTISDITSIVLQLERKVLLINDIYSNEAVTYINNLVNNWFEEIKNVADNEYLLSDLIYQFNLKIDIILNVLEYYDLTHIFYEEPQKSHILILLIDNGLNLVNSKKYLLSSNLKDTFNLNNNWLIYNDDKYFYQWIITIKVSSNNYPASKINKFLWAFTEILESISGVHVEIESAGTGSIWMKFRAFFESDEVKEEAKKLLDKGRKGLEAEYLDKPIANNEKTQAEARKVNAEADTVQRQLESLPDSEEAKLLKQIDIKKKELELRKLQAEIEKVELENRKLELENLEKGVSITEKLAYMIKEGMLSADSVTIDINGLPFLSSENGRIIQGASLDEIDAKGLTKPDNDGKK
ncbi:hypothetical protein H6G64_35320 [Calothrix sp. FACHB-156]|nr:hypothetical protein [Calothrix sp. FACHB-156]